MITACPMRLGLPAIAARQDISPLDFLQRADIAMTKRECPWGKMTLDLRQWSSSPAPRIASFKPSVTGKV